MSLESCGVQRCSSMYVSLYFELLSLYTGTFPSVYLLCFEVGCVRGRKRTACVEVEGDNMQLITGP